MSAIPPSRGGRTQQRRRPAPPGERARSLARWGYMAVAWACLDVASALTHATPPATRAPAAVAAWVFCSAISPALSVFPGIAFFVALPQSPARNWTIGHALLYATGWTVILFVRPSGIPLWGDIVIAAGGIIALGQAWAMQRAEKRASRPRHRQHRRGDS